MARNQGKLLLTSLNNRITLQQAKEAIEIHGSKRAAAESLGVSRRTLFRCLAGEGAWSNNERVKQIASEKQIPLDHIKSIWLKDKETSIQLYRPDEAPLNYDDIRADLIDEMKKHAPVYEKASHQGGDHLLVIDAADVHIGKYCNPFLSNTQYDIEEAVRRLKVGSAELYRKASLHGVGRTLFVIGNDILHADNKNGTTTKGTRQDMAGQMFEVYNMARRTYVAMIEQLATYAPVEVVYCPSNHDEETGYYLADSVAGYLSNNPNVSFGNNYYNISKRDRKYFAYGDNLLGFCHGDGAKRNDLPNLAQYDVRDLWAKAKGTYIYVHHLHHKVRTAHHATEVYQLEKDHTGVTIINTGHVPNPSDHVFIETLRSPSPPDQWHDKHGYVNMQAVECFLHHPQQLQVARITHYF